MAVTPHGDSPKDYGAFQIYVDFFMWIANHPSEVIAFVLMSILTFFFLRWITKYKFHEIFLYRPERDVERYVGRLLRKSIVLRDIPGHVRCTHCNLVFTYSDKDMLKDFECECKNRKYEVRKEPQNKVKHIDMIFITKLLPIKTAILTIPYKKANLTKFKKNFYKADPKARIYQRIGIRGMYLFKSEESGLLEVTNTPISSQIYSTANLKENISRELKTTGNFVYKAMGGNSAVLAPLVQDGSMPLIDYSGK